MKRRTRPRGSALQAAAFLVVLLASASAGCAPAPAPSLPEAVSVPVNAEGAGNIGALHLELVYDPTVLEATEVEKGMLASNAMLEFNIDVPGRVIVGMVDAAGISGVGPLAIVSFRVVGSDAAACALTLEKLTAHNATTLVDIPAQSSSGSFVVKDRSFTIPVILFAP